MGKNSTQTHWNEWRRESWSFQGHSWGSSGRRWWREAKERSLRILAEGSSTTQALGGPPLKESGNTDKTKVKVTEKVQHCSLEVKVGLKFLLLRMQQKSKLDIK